MFKGLRSGLNDGKCFRDTERFAIKGGGAGEEGFDHYKIDDDELILR